jgi:hypothetical protein
MADAKIESLIQIERVAGRIYPIRCRKVMFDFDLADLYGAETKALNRAVSRNQERFPPDFMFRLEREEMENMSNKCLRLCRSKRSHRLHSSQGLTEPIRAECQAESRAEALFSDSL